MLVIDVARCSGRHGSTTLQSLSAKVPLVDRFGLRGIAIWALGNEGAGTWTELTSFGRQLARAQ